MSDYKKWRTCSRKKGYETLSKANKAAKRLDWDKFTNYECPYCYMWHITKRKKVACTPNDHS